MQDPSADAEQIVRQGLRQTDAPDVFIALAAALRLQRNPNLPDGLRMVHIDELTRDEAKQVGLPPRRAGPKVA